MDFNSIISSQKDYFFSQQTKSFAFRIEQLKKLKTKLKESESLFLEALKKDLGKGEFESYLSEIGFVYEDIEFTISNLKKWMKEKKFRSPIAIYPAKSFLQHEPYGISLIISPFNYPYQLLLAPLVGSMAAGNCCILKPSELTSNTQKVFCDFFKKHFPENYIACVGGGVAETQKLLEHQFDHIFFTGSTRVGKIILKAAAEHLTPVCLELGGKSPCIVDESADLKISARRIVWGKFFNAGQTCVAPDYIYVHESVKDLLLKELKNTIIEFYGEDPLKSEDFGRIVNESHFNRLIKLLKNENIYYGGATDLETKYIAPTLIDHVKWDSQLMSEEIFGPILPVMTYQNEEEMIQTLLKKEKPLALYLFTRNKELEKKVLQRISFGGGCVNDCVVHLSNPRIPFGGVGQSGMGAYHGEFGFQTFSHQKSVVKNSFWIDLKLRYAPYSKSKLNLIRKLFR